MPRPKKVQSFVILEDNDGQFYWRVASPANGKILSMSSESYHNKMDCLAGAFATLEVLKNQLTLLAENLNLPKGE